jgi:hypothetical protein
MDCNCPFWQRIRFSQGLASVLRQWTVLTLAVTNQWGGTDSEEKAAMLFDEILDEFLHPKEGTLYRDVSLEPADASEQVLLDLH